jgi:hypothetical protein
MAITFAQLAAMSTSTSNTSSYAGTAGTPNAGDLLICGVVATATVAAGTMTGTWTWKKLTSFTKNSGADTIYIFWAYASAATSTTPTFDCTGDNASACSIYCYRVTGSEGVQVPSIRQIATATGTAANPSVAMKAAIDTNNGCIGFAANGTNSAVQWTAPTNWIEGGEVTLGTSPAGSFEGASRASGETLSTIAWTNANTTAWGIIVLELWVPHARSAGGGAATSSPMGY